MNILCTLTPLLLCPKKEHGESLEIHLSDRAGYKLSVCCHWVTEWKGSKCSTHSIPQNQCSLLWDTLIIYQGQNLHVDKIVKQAPLKDSQKWKWNETVKATKGKKRCIFDAFKGWILRPGWMRKGTARTRRGADAIDWVQKQSRRPAKLVSHARCWHQGQAVYWGTRASRQHRNKKHHLNFQYECGRKN